MVFPLHKMHAPGAHAFFYIDLHPLLKAEQNTASAMAAMATCGLIPFISTFAVFASMRACAEGKLTEKAGC